MLKAQCTQEEEEWWWDAEREMEYECQTMNYQGPTNSVSESISYGNVSYGKHSEPEMANEET